MSLISIEPSIQDYARMLALIVKDTSSNSDRIWAADELVRVVCDQKQLIDQLAGELETVRNWKKEIDQ